MKNTSRRNRITSWAIYTVGCFLIMLIGFNWEISISISLIVGFLFGLLNEIIFLISKTKPTPAPPEEGIENAN